VKYPLNEPNLSDLENHYVNDALQSGWLSAGGKHTREFEKLFSDYLGVKYTVAVQSGTAALHLALKAVGVSKGDTVMIPNYSCGATISSVCQCGATPVVMDIETDTFGLNSEYLECAIKKYKPIALQLVHVYGFPARDTVNIKEICKNYGVILIEDASEALGAELEGNKIGTFGDIATFSTRSEKMIGVGEGGVVVTNNTELYNKTLQLASRNAPLRSKDDNYWDKYYYSGEGYNYLLPHLLGAVARAQMERFPEILAEKKRVGKSFRSVFKDNNFWRLQNIANNSNPVFWLNSILFKTLNEDLVRSLGQYLQKKGIDVRSGFIPLSNMDGFLSIPHDSQVVGEELYSRLLVLPSVYWLSKTDFIKMHDIIIEYLKRR